MNVDIFICLLGIGFCCFWIGYVIGRDSGLVKAIDLTAQTHPRPRPASGSEAAEMGQKDGSADTHSIESKKHQ